MIDRCRQRGENPPMSKSRSRMFDDDASAGPHPSPRTTIVGGRPPEEGAKLPPVPTGIQSLLRLASVDPGFLAELCAHRAEVAPSAGIDLTANERAILGAIPAEDLELMARQLPPQEPERHAFLREIAAAAVVLLASAAFGCQGSSPGCGHRHEISDPGTRPTVREMESEGGIAPHAPPAPSTRPDTDPRFEITTPDARPKVRESARGGGARNDKPALPPGWEPQQKPEVVRFSAGVRPGQSHDSIREKDLPPRPK
jgi:hypothetical protein